MAVEIKFTIKNCNECRHRDHSGAFTPGGAKPICGHGDACVKRVAESKDKYDWKNRVIDPKTIPDWCPLKRGSKY